MDKPSVKDLSQDGLTEKQRRFVEAYTGEAHGNATESARLAGYAGNDVTLGQVGAENLKKPQIAAAIQAALEPIRKAAIMTRERRQELLSKFAEGDDPTALADDPEAPFIPVKDRIKAIEVLGKMQGDFVEKREVTVTNGVTVYLPDNGRDPEPEE
jgi:phage terminase small subunit